MPDQPAALLPLEHQQPPADGRVHHEDVRAAITRIIPRAAREGLTQHWRLPRGVYAKNNLALYLSSSSPASGSVNRARHSPRHSRLRQGSNANEGQPSGPLAEGPPGVFQGTVRYGGRFGRGSLIRIDTSSGVAVTEVHIRPYPTAGSLFPAASRRAPEASFTASPTSTASSATARCSDWTRPAASRPFTTSDLETLDQRMPSSST